MCAADSVSRETDTGDAGCPGGPVSRETAASPRRNPLSRALVFALLLPIKVYSRFISPALPPRCRYYPTCSTYAQQALAELGPFKGSIVAAWRVMRCNPLSPGGMDPLEARTLFRSGGTDRPPSHAGTA